MSKEKSLYVYDGHEITQKSIEQSLISLGLQKGDIALVHSDVSTFGKLGDIKDINEFLRALLNAFLNILGDGTLVVPTYTYSFCKKETFDVKNSKSTVGIFSEFVRNQPSAVRSEDPIFSHAAIGKNAEKLLKGVGSVCFGRESFFDRFYKINGKIINFGKFFDITFLHYIERKFNVDYRFDKKFYGKIIKKNGKEEIRKVTYYVRHLSKNGKGVGYDMPRLGDELQNRGLLKKIDIGNSFILCSKARDCFDVGLEMLKSNNHAFLESNFNQSVKKAAKNDHVGENEYNLVEKSFSICRSITGNGVRETLKILQEYIPIKIHEVPTGTKVFDWVVPKEWNIKNAYVADKNGNKIIDFKKNNLHVVGYSVPINKVVSLAELQKHLHSLPEQPKAIPYITSYYKETWGFCIAHEDRERLKNGKYKVFIDSELKDGSLTYGELIISGKSKKEVFLSTYICHPSMANDGLSGPVVTTSLARWILEKPRRCTYRIIFIPETIGSIAYLSKNLKIMKKNIIAGFNVTCVGDERTFSYLPTRYGDTYADKVALNVLNFKHPDFIKWSFLDRGSDERQYCAPGIDLPVASIMRSKYDAFPEYHTSLDNLELVTQKGLTESYEVLKECLNLLENNYRFRIKSLGEPQLGKRGLYPTESTKSTWKLVENMMNFIAYADGSKDLAEISNIINVPVWEIYSIVEKLQNAGLLEKLPLV